jgi:hypothetical protein
MNYITKDNEPSPLFQSFQIELNEYLLDRGTEQYLSSYVDVLLQANARDTTVIDHDTTHIANVKFALLFDLTLLLVCCLL